MPSFHRSNDFVTQWGGTSQDNELDSGGRHQGRLTFRWFWPQGDDPSPSTPLVKQSEIASLMPGAAERVDAAAGAAEIRDRKRHLIWRFRT